ncbi:MAG TPA: FAD-dependent 5-carboxymethylaminomethyl-2-thiouridine(34) oxidoreductase MnmC [Rhodoferax sp.]|nr:FAD-dependent 5-carboxymethylaminomethyl-2-thiouridine(34) oxidoreductase MnmC [Rhodoferax sp.]
MPAPQAGVVQADQAAAKLWQGSTSWRVLDTDFHHGRAFFETWLAWQRDPDRPRLLHYVALCPLAPSPQSLTDRCADEPDLQALAASLAKQWFGILPGFHRFLLADGQVTLTLCAGDAMHLLRQQQFHADWVTLRLAADKPPGALEAQSLWSIKALARCCRRGTRLQCLGAQPTDLAALSSHLKQCGFDLASGPAHQAGIAAFQLTAVFHPSWTLKSARQPGIAQALPVQRCAVIGAGLAGASVAASLARRGWQVLVLDQGADAAAGASGLPVGLVVPHVSSDDCSLSRLSRAGVRMMLQQADQHLQAFQQWAPSGVLERQIDGTPELPAQWPDAGKAWCMQASAMPAGATTATLGPSLWHAKAAWIKPAELVRAWLRQPGVSFQTNARVSSLRFDAGVWQLLDATGAVLCVAERVVLANACGARDLLQALASQSLELAQRLKDLPATQGMRGLLSWARHADSASATPHFAPCPVNGSGSMISQVPTQDGQAWFAGSSYQPDSGAERADQDNHASNLTHLQKLLPALASELAPMFASNALNTWKSTRCVSSDRMPLVGPLDAGRQPGLWICAGLGSRGLSFSVLCAELLAARMGAEPLPVEANLANALEALRG